MNTLPKELEKNEGVELGNINIKESKNESHEKLKQINENKIVETNLIKIDGSQYGKFEENENRDEN